MMAGQRRDNLVGDGFDIERFGQCGHAWTLSEVLEGANGYKSASRAHGRSRHISSFRGNAGRLSLSERNGHHPVVATGSIRR